MNYNLIIFKDTFLYINIDEEIFYILDAQRYQED